MAPFLIQLAVFFILNLINHFLSFSLNEILISFGVMFIMTGVAHFTKLEAMVYMFPSFIPFKKTLVWLSGIFEIIAGILLCFSLGPTHYIVLSLMIFLVLSLPLNIYSAVYSTGLGAKGVKYLWFRVPLQVFWFSWLYFSLPSR